MGLTRRALLLAAASGAPFAQAAMHAAEPAEIVWPLPSAPAVLIPGASNAAGTRFVGSKIYRGLMRWAADGTLQPDLADGIELSADGLTYTIRLRPGITWHDSGGFTAADVAFSITRFHRALQPQLRLERVASLTTPDPLTVILTLAAADDAFLRLLDGLTLPIVPQHVHDRPDWGLDPRHTKPVGTGPFRFDDWLRLVRFDWYAGPKPAIATLHFPILPDPAARLSLAQAGAPVLLAGDAVALAAIPRLRSMASLAVEGDASPAAAAMAGLLLNPAAKPLDLAEVRIGLACAIDRQRALRDAWAGLGQAATGPAVASSLNRNDAATLPQHDSRAAAEHFNTAGLRPDDDGIRARLRYLHPPGMPWEGLVPVLRASLQQVGIELTPEAVAEPEWTRRVAAGDYQMTGFLSDQMGDPAIDLAAYATVFPELAPLLRGGPAGEREAQSALTAKMPALWLVEPAIAVVRDKRLHVPGGILGSFDEASLGTP